MEDSADAPASPEAVSESNEKPVSTIVTKARYAGGLLFVYGIGVPVMAATQTFLFATHRSHRERAEKIEDMVNGALGAVVTRILGKQPHDY